MRHAENKNDRNTVPVIQSWICKPTLRQVDAACKLVSRLSHESKAAMALQSISNAPLTRG